MATTSAATIRLSSFTNRVLHGDCIELMRQIPTNSVDFILTDAPYLENYRDRTGRTIQNDADDTWLKPAMAEAYRVLKQDRVAVMFYRWTKVDAFFEAGRSAGFSLSDTSSFARARVRRVGFSAISTSRHFCWPKADRHCRSSRSAM